MEVPGFAAQTIKNGTRHVAIHYSADEEKGPEWVAIMKSRLATEGFGERDWQREMELREDIYNGEPVFADYVDHLHCPKPLHDAPIPVRRIQVNRPHRSRRRPPRGTSWRSRTRCLNVRFISMSMITPGVIRGRHSLNYARTTGLNSDALLVSSPPTRTRPRTGTG